MPIKYCTPFDPLSPIQTDRLNWIEKLYQISERLRFSQSKDCKLNNGLSVCQSMKFVNPNLMLYPNFCAG